MDSSLFLFEYFEKVMWTVHFRLDILKKVSAQCTFRLNMFEKVMGTVLFLVDNV